MIRKQLIATVLAVATFLTGSPAAESQEIRLQPPQLDRQGIIRRARPTQPEATYPSRGMSTSAMSANGMSANGMSASAVRQAAGVRRGSPRMGVARVARQEPIGQTRGQGIYDLAAQQGQNPNMMPGMIQPGGEIIHEGPWMPDGVIMEGEGMIMDGEYCPDPCVVCPPVQLISFADMEYSLGVQGFKGVPNLGQSGSFGFNQGINWGFPMPILPALGLSGQIGARFTQADFYGANFTDDSRHQTFLSAGLSRRVDYGFQMGVVLDYLNENWYYEGSFAQIRSEFSWVGGYGNQIGFRYISAVQDSSEEVAEGLMNIGNNLVTDITPLNTYRFFYRHQWDQMRGGHVEAMGGFTENGDAIFGSEFLIPIAERWALTTDFTCLLPADENLARERLGESWNIGLGLTWYPKGLSTWSQLYHRPLFNVADNGTFMFQPE